MARGILQAVLKDTPPLPRARPARTLNDPAHLGKDADVSVTISNTVVYDVEYITQVFSSQSISAGSAIGLQITAPTGKVVLGGGGTGAGVAGVAIEGSFPGGSGSLPDIWTVDYRNLSGSNVTITVTLSALCARVAAL